MSGFATDPGQFSMSGAYYPKGHTFAMFKDAATAQAAAARVAGVPQIGQVVDAMFDAGLVDVRIAFVELRDDIEGSELGETMCLERGMTIRIFSQETLARRWLIYGD